MNPGLQTNPGLIWKCGGVGGDRTRVQNTSTLNIYERSLIIFLAREMIDGQIILPASQVTFNVLATDRSRHAISGILTPHIL
jgi:hypothetical protein